MKYVFICKVKIMGTPFAVLTEELAKEWVALDPDWNYYDKVPVKSSVL